MLLAIALGYPGQPHVVSRFMAMSESASMAAARCIAMGWAVLVYSGMIVLGLCGRILHEQVIDNDETLFFTLTTELFPTVIAAVMTAAVLSAIMSTADSQLLVAGSAVSHDLGVRGRTKRSALWSSRVVVLAVSAAAVWLALLGIDADAVAGTDDGREHRITGKIFSSVLIAWTAIGAAFGPLLVITLWRGRVSAIASFAGMAVGFGSTAVFYSLGEPTRGTIWERLVPYLLAAGAILLLSAGRRRSTGPTTAG